MIRFPKNIILTEQYSSGGEFINTSDNTPYKGYYHIINGKTFSGKIHDSKSQLLEHVETRNKKNKINLNILKKYIYSPSENDIKKGMSKRYFTKKINETPINISEINYDTYLILKNKPEFATLELNWNLQNNNDFQIEEAEKKFTGIKLFLSLDNNSIDSRIS